MARTGPPVRQATVRLSLWEVQVKTNQVTPETIELWKSEYGAVWRVQISGQQFYYRALTRQEYQQLQRQMAEGKFGLDELDDRIVETALLSPDWSAGDFNQLAAGVLFTLARKIREASGFVEREVPADRLFDQLPRFDVSDEQVEQAKSTHRYLALVRVGDSRFLVKPISRQEWNEIRRQDLMSGQFDVEVEVCRYGLVAPDSEQVLSSELPAGYITQISNAILQASGFGEEPTVEEVL